jgi:hypothetical protein
MRCGATFPQKGSTKPSMALIHLDIYMILLCLYGGEGGIRTPDSLATMSDFESGVETQALNIYKGIILRKASVLAGVSVCKAGSK